MLSLPLVTDSDRMVDDKTVVLVDTNVRFNSAETNLNNNDNSDNDNNNNDLNRALSRTQQNA